jgi:hypothetical protein
MNPSFIDIIINQLKANCPIFQGNVAGAGDLATDFNKAQTVNLPTPAAYVVPVRYDYGENQAGTGTWKRATATYAVVVAQTNPDRRGQQAATNIDQIGWYISQSLQHFVVDPDRCSLQGIDIIDSSILNMDAARLWWQFNIEFEYSIGDEDAWQPQGTPLNNINVNIPLAQTFTPALPTTTNYVHFANANPSDAASFTAAMQTDDLSAISGVTFSVYADDMEDGNFATVNTVLSAVPSNFVLKIGMSANNTNSGLSTTKTYPFQTVIVNSMVGPVLSDPNFYTWMIQQWQALYNYLATQNAASRLVCLGIAPCSNNPGDGEFNVPRNPNNTAAQNIAFWSALGVTDATVPTLLAGYVQLLAQQTAFANCKFVMAFKNPTLDVITGVGDNSVSYTTITQALQAASPNYVTYDQSLNAPQERGEIRAVATGHPYCCQIIESLTNAQAIAAYKTAIGYSPEWVEIDTQYIPIISAWLQGLISGRDAADSYNFNVSLT